MDQTPDTAVPVIERKGCGSFYPASAPEDPGHGIIILEMIVGPRDKYVTLRTDKLFITHKMIAAGIAYPREKKT
jgi:hypothetical protein